MARAQERSAGAGARSGLLPHRPIKRTRIIKQHVPGPRPDRPQTQPSNPLFKQSSLFYCVMDGLHVNLTQIGLIWLCHQKNMNHMRSRRGGWLFTENTGGLLSQLKHAGSGVRENQRGACVGLLYVTGGAVECSVAWKHYLLFSITHEQQPPTSYSIYCFMYIMYYPRLYPCVTHFLYA